MSDGCQHCVPCAIQRVDDKVDLLLSATSRLEASMAKQADAINDLGGKFDQLSGVVTDIHSDFEALRAVLESERENLSDAGQAALDAANAKAEALRQTLTDLDVAVGDADGSDIPAPAPGDGGGAPAGGDVPAEPGDGDATPTA